MDNLNLICLNLIVLWKKSCYLAFGQAGAAAQQGGTGLVKFNAPCSMDTMVKNGVSTSINTRHQCITAMKEYTNKSLEVGHLIACHYKRKYV